MRLQHVIPLFLQRLDLRLVCVDLCRAGFDLLLFLAAVKRLTAVEGLGHVESEIGNGFGQLVALLL